MMCECDFVALRVHKNVLRNVVENMTFDKAVKLFQILTKVKIKLMANFHIMERTAVCNYIFGISRWL